jgi:hypothetical protein
MMSLGQMQAVRNKTENRVEQALWEIAMLLKAGQAADNGLHPQTVVTPPIGEWPAKVKHPHKGRPPLHIKAGV